MVSSKDGSMIITGSVVVGEIISWNVEEAIRLQTFTGHSRSIWGMFLIHDDTYLISISYDKTIRFWNMQSADCLATIDVGDKLYCGVINPTTTRLFTGSIANTIKEWCNTL